MKRRRINFNARDLMAKHGQLLYIRGLLNLHTDLVDNVPEFYWSRADLAKHFESISRTLDVLPRIKVLNQRYVCGVWVFLGVDKSACML